MSFNKALNALQATIYSMYLIEMWDSDWLYCKSIFVAIVVYFLKDCFRFFSIPITGWPQRRQTTICMYLIYSWHSHRSHIEPVPQWWWILHSPWAFEFCYRVLVMDLGWQRSTCHNVSCTWFMFGTLISLPCTWTGILLIIAELWRFFIFCGT